MVLVWKERLDSASALKNVENSITLIYNKIGKRLIRWKRQHRKQTAIDNKYWKSMEKPPSSDSYMIDSPFSKTAHHNCSFEWKERCPNRERNPWLPWRRRCIFAFMRLQRQDGFKRSNSLSTGELILYSGLALSAGVFCVFKNYSETRNRVDSPPCWSEFSGSDFSGSEVWENRESCLHTKI